MHVIRSDTTKICKKFVRIDKDLDRINNCLLMKGIPNNNNFAKTQQKGTSGYENEKVLDNKTDRMT